ncbi:MAG: GIY-YIG nuclease family protein [Chloroflexota bacterium]
MDKDYILKEIDRTAKENGGKPLGRGKFAKETGIKVQDWWGKYWSKWNDAVIEAGYSPNKMQAALNSSVMLEQIISLIREIGKFPTVGEYRLKAYNTKGFPAHNTIRERLGKQSEVASKIISYCEAHPECSDILEICKNVTGIYRNESSHYKKEPDVEHGYVYLMKSGRFYKIGCSSNVERRNYDIGLKLPEPIDILHKITTDDPTGIENYWHIRFKDKRKQGEWFDLSREDVSAFKRRKLM